MTRQYLVQGNPAVLRPREASAAQRLRSSRHVGNRDFRESPPVL